MLFLDSVIFNLQKAGGISKYWSKILDGLHKRDFKYKEIVYDNDNIFSVETQKSVQGELLPVRMHRYLDVNCNAERNDVFHSSYFRLPKNRIPTVCTVHDFMYELFDAGIKKRIHVWQKKRCMENSDVIICVSKHTQNDLFKIYPQIANKKHIEVVYNGVDDDFIDLNLSLDDSFEIDGRILKRGRFLLYVGSRKGCKNFEQALSLASYFIQRDPELKLICVGGGELEESESLNYSHMINNIIHLSFIENDKLNILYNLALALIFTSSYEGFGIPALEAQKAGCPVIFQSVSSLVEVMGYDDTDINTNSYDDIYHSISDDSLRDTIIKKGIDKASQFSWDQTIEGTLKSYRKAIQIYNRN